MVQSVKMCPNLFSLNMVFFNWKHSWDSKDPRTVLKSTTDCLYENRTSLSLAHPSFPVYYRDNSKQVSQKHSKSAFRCCKRRHSTAQVDRSVRAEKDIYTTSIAYFIACICLVSDLHIMISIYLKAAMLEMDGERDCMLGDDTDLLWLWIDE